MNRLDGGTIKPMRRLTWILLLACGGLACSKTSSRDSTASGGGSAEFDQKWAALAASDVEPFYIENNGGGEGLMGNVRRARRQGALAPKPAPPASPDSPDPVLVQQVIRQNLDSVKACYMRISRDGDRRSGKAIVSFVIGAGGDVQGAQVDAPSFEGTSLPHCVGSLVAHWSFPKSEKGGLTISYPFVFVGG